MPNLSIKSPEFQLLLSCAKVKAGAKELARRESAISMGIDWHLFLALANRHLVQPMAFVNLSKDERVPFFVIESLKRSFAVNQLKVLNAQRFQIRLQKFWDERRIKGIFLKGIALAQTYYGDIAMRHFSDIDCWVEHERLDEVVAWLETLGYRKDSIWENLTERQLSHLKAVEYHVHLRTTNSDLPAMVEVHWTLQDRQGNFKLNPENETGSLIALPANDVSLMALGHYDNFIYLCAHGCRHGWYRLKWLFDLPQLLDQGIMDWDALFKRATLLDTKEQVTQSLLLMHSLFQRDLPQQFQGRTLDQGSGYAMKFFLDQISNQGEYSATLNEKTSRFIFLLKQNRGTFFRKKFWKKNLTSPTDWKFFPLPDRLFRLYYLLRPVLWLLRQFYERMSNARNAGSHA